MRAGFHIVELGSKVESTGERHWLIPDPDAHTENFHSESLFDTPCPVLSQRKPFKLRNHLNELYKSLLMNRLELIYQNSEFGYYPAVYIDTNQIYLRFSFEAGIVLRGSFEYSDTGRADPKWSAGNGSQC